MRSWRVEKVRDVDLDWDILLFLCYVYVLFTGAVLAPVKLYTRTRLFLVDSDAYSARLVDYFDWHVKSPFLFYFFTAARSRLLRERGL